MSEISFTFLQFGTGRFLRSFADLFIHEANRNSKVSQNICVVQSTGSERARQLAAGSFHVAVRGLSGGTVVDSVERVESVARGLAADSEFEAVKEIARNRQLQAIVSNTTEAGLALDERDSEPGTRFSFPAKLLDVLVERHLSGESGLTILPCELVDQNAKVILDLVLKQAEIWKLDPGTVEWIREENQWCSTLVDRIVSAPPVDHPLLASDPLLSVTEPYAFWAIESTTEPPITHSAVECVADVSRYALRKVRILNGAHTALVERARDAFETVREAMADHDTREWLTSLVGEEIVPCLSERVDAASQFAADVFERFENPFLDHRLADIAMHQEEKIKVRLLPTYQEYSRKFGKPPAMLGQVLAKYV